MTTKIKITLAITGLYLVLLCGYFALYFVFSNFAIPCLSPFRVIMGLLIGGVAYEVIFKEFNLSLLHCLFVLTIFYPIASLFISSIIVGCGSIGFFSHSLFRALIMLIISAVPLLLSVFIERFYWYKN